MSTCSVLQCTRITRMGLVCTLPPLFTCTTEQMRTAYYSVHVLLRWVWFVHYHYYSHVQLKKCVQRSMPVKPAT